MWADGRGRCAGVSSGAGRACLRPCSTGLSPAWQPVRPLSFLEARRRAAALPNIPIPRPPCLHDVCGDRGVQQGEQLAAVVRGHARQQRGGGEGVERGEGIHLGGWADEAFAVGGFGPWAKGLFDQLARRGVPHRAGLLPTGRTTKKQNGKRVACA